MIALTIIALLVSLVSLVVTLSFRREIHRVNNELNDLKNEDKSLNNLITGVELRVDDLEKED